MDRHRPALTRRWALLLAAPPLAFLGLFFLWPVANILALGLAPVIASAEEELVPRIPPRR